MSATTPSGLRPLPVPRNVQPESGVARFLFKGGNLEDLEDHHK